MIVFGDMLEITCQEAGQTYRFNPKANESFTVDTGGIRNNDDANQATSNGILMVQKNFFRGSIEGPIANELGTDVDLKKLAASVLPQTWTFVHISGQIFKSVGGGVIVGDIQADKNAGTFNLKVAAAQFEVIG